MNTFTEISVRVDGEAAEAVAETLRPFAYQESVVLEQKGDEHSLDPMAVESAVTVKIYLPQSADTPALRRKIEEILYHMNRLYPIPAPRFTVLEEKDWAHAWKEAYHPFRVGARMWIQPSWIDQETLPAAAQAGPDDIVLIMDPGMAFGTGLHPTTQSCLTALENLVEAGDRVLDVGTGTGILAIAAAKLGAATITAVDTDEQAVTAVRENVRLNGVEGLVRIWHGDLAGVSERSWQVIAVNILAPIIIGMLSSGELLDYAAPTGRLILSGIIDTQFAAVEVAVAAAQGRILDVIRRGDWVTLIVAPGPGES